MTAPEPRDRLADAPGWPTQRWQRRGYREVAALALLGSWATAIWLTPEVPLHELQYPFLVLGFTGIFCYRVLGAPRLILGGTDLVSAGVFQTWTIPYDEIVHVDADHGITLFLQDGQEVTVAGMPTSLFQAITGDRRLARLSTVLEERVSSRVSVPAQPRARATLAPFVTQIALLVGVFAVTYLLALLTKLL